MGARQLTSLSAVTGFLTDAFAVPTASRRYEGRVAIVTGAAQGLGRVVARRLAEEGASVVVADLQTERVERVAGELGEETGGRFLAAGGDLSKPGVADEMVERALAELGQVDTLVNNAAALIRLPLVEFTEDLMQKAVDGNWWTLVRATKAVLPHMLERGYGRVVNVGGEAWRVGYPFHSFLGGGKGAMVGFTTCLAAEVIKNGITVNCLSPGPFEADNDGDPQREPRHQPAGWTPPEVLQSLIAMGGGPAIGRLAHPTEVAAAIAFLGAPEASYVTGQHFGASGMPLA
jgi:NAD(P)-dependent dehydrogenase (short-subunit alcohol dehydrogenase family)